MTGFALSLLDGRTAQRIAGLASLVAADASGAFGVLPRHEDFVTVLEPGLLRWRRTDAAAGDWRWAACTGGLLRVAAGEVTIVSRRFVQDGGPEALQRGLDDLMARESALRISTRESRAQLDAALLKRLQQLAEPSR